MRERKRKLLKYRLQSYSNHVYLHDYCSIFVYLQRFRKTDVGVFCAMLCKILQFLHFTLIDVIAQGWQNQPKLICPPKPTYLNKTQTYPIVNWVKWVLNINPININVYWVLIGYPIRLNYDPSIISTNHPTLEWKGMKRMEPQCQRQPLIPCIFKLICTLV